MGSLTSVQTWSVQSKADLASNPTARHISVKQLAHSPHRPCGRSKEVWIGHEANCVSSRETCTWHNLRSKLSGKQSTATAERAQPIYTYMYTSALYHKTTKHNPFPPLKRRCPSLDSPITQKAPNDSQQATTQHSRSASPAALRGRCSGGSASPPRTPCTRTTPPLTPRTTSPRA